PPVVASPEVPAQVACAGDGLPEAHRDRLSAATCQTLPDDLRGLPERGLCSPNELPRHPDLRNPRGALEEPLGLPEPLANSPGRSAVRTEVVRYGLEGAARAREADRPRSGHARAARAHLIALAGVPVRAHGPVR